jgi:hypothetical protein
VAGRAAAGPVRRLHVDGRQFARDGGTRFSWQGVTAFKLVALVAAGQAADAERYLAWASEHDVTIVRTLAMLGDANHDHPTLFYLPPAAGRAALPRLLDLAARHGLYVEVVALAGTRFETFDRAAHVSEIGTICARHPACLVEIANEPQHQTQDRRVWDPSYLGELARDIPDDVPVALGAAHGGNDRDTSFTGGDYATVHLDRTSGEDGWQWVRRTKLAYDLSVQLGKPVINDEGKRDDFAPDKHLAVALICRIFGIGDTFHYQDGLGATVPSGRELTAFEARRRGWRAIPADYSGAADEALLPASELPHGATLFASRSGNVGYIVGIRVPPDAALKWPAGWSATLVTSDGETRLWKLTARR